LFLLVLYFLPRWESRNTPRYESRQKLVIAVSVGVVFTLVALSVKSGKLFTSISAYFEDSEEKAGASNIVSTILGDFRAFDTMPVVFVLLRGRIGGFSLNKGQKEEDAHKRDDK